MSMQIYVVFVLVTDYRLLKAAPSTPRGNVLNEQWDDDEQDEASWARHVTSTVKFAGKLEYGHTEDRPPSKDNLRKHLTEVLVLPA